MGWGHPVRRTALGLGAEVKITSVSFGSALPAEVDATSAGSNRGELPEVSPPLLRRHCYGQVLKWVCSEREFLAARGRCNFNEFDGQPNASGVVTYELSRRAVSSGLPSSRLHGLSCWAILKKTLCFWKRASLEVFDDK